MSVSLRSAHDMEGIKDHVGNWKIRHGHGNVGRTHVYDDPGDMLGPAPVLGPRRGKLPQGIRPLILCHHQQVIALGINHVGHAMPGTAQSAAAAPNRYDVSETAVVLLAVCMPN